MRACKNCGKSYPLSAAYYRLSFNVAKDGTKRPTYRKTCLPCERRKTRAHVFRLTRGITHEQRDTLLQKQGGVCAACASTVPASKKGWHVDHDHATGQVRGVLCANCNTALGHAQDSVERLEKLITYLKARCNDYPSGE